MDSIKDVSKTIKAIVRNELQFYTAKGIEKISMLVGLIITIFLLAGLGFIALVFVTIALGNYLNDLFESSSMGYILMGGFYLLLIVFILLVSLVQKAPLFTNLVVRQLVSFLEIGDDEKKTNTMI